MRSKKGSVLSVIVTIFIMLAVLCGLLIFMIKENMITLNEDVINNFFGINNEIVETPPTVLNQLEEYEKVQDGIDLKHFISVIGNNEYSEITVYISDVQYNEANATPDKAAILFMTNGRIANSEEYIKISNDIRYKVIMQRNEIDKSVEKVYIIKLMEDIAE